MNAIARSTQENRTVAAERRTDTDVGLTSEGDAPSLSGLTRVVTSPASECLIGAALDVTEAVPAGELQGCADPGLCAFPFIQRLRDERPPAQARVTGLAWSSRFRVHHPVADHYRAGRRLVAGDVAHVHSPAGGQGMNTVIQDGYALGGAFATDHLDGYEAQRRPVAHRVVAFADRMTRIATTRSKAIRGVRNIALPLFGRLPTFRTRLATEFAELNYR